MTDAPKDNDSSTDKNTSHYLGRAYLLALLFILLAAFIYTVRMFVMPVFLAAVFTVLFYPLYELLLKWMKGKATLASLTTCLLLMILLLGPMYFIGDMVASEAIDLYNTAEEKVKTVIEEGEEGPLGWIQERIPQQYLENFDWKNNLTGVLKTSGSMIGNVINATSRKGFSFVLNLFMMIFTMFYFFQDGPRMVKRLKFYSPLDDSYEDQLFQRFTSVSRATIKGSLVLGLIQGVMGGLTLWAFGVPSVILWSVVMVVLSVIPMVGGWLVLYPAAIVQLLTGHIWQGVAIIIITALVIGNVDNLIRPRLVGRDAKLHDLLIFFSTLGGISVFGIMGFIIGPVIAALLLTILEIYGIEFKDQLSD
ncbi:AI-2E family transporter [bacterium]|nr:AI-2E family transporter [bacterium]